MTDQEKAAKAKSIMDRFFEDFKALDIPRDAIADTLVASATGIHYGLGKTDEETMAAVEATCAATLASLPEPG